MPNNELPFVKNMFEKIAPRYDLLNHLLSLRRDVLWRKTLVSALDIPIDGKVLDIACGTGDIAIEIVSQKKNSVSVFAADFTPKMLTLAKDKIKDLILGSQIHLFAADAFYLPFAQETFDAVTIAFGIRNIVDKQTVLKKFYESLKPEGMLLVLELTTPEKGFLSFLYLYYFKKILPLIGLIFSKNLKAYKYLPASVANFEDAKTFTAKMRLAGFKDVKWKKLTMGIATLFIGYKK